MVHDKLLIKRILRRSIKEFIRMKKSLLGKDKLSLSEVTFMEKILKEWEEYLYKENQLELSMMDRKIFYWWFRGLLHGFIIFVILWFVSVRLF